MKFDQKAYPYSYPIDTEDPGFLNWFRPRLTKINIMLVLMVVLVQPFDPFISLFCPLLSIISMIVLNQKQKSLTAITHPLLFYLALSGSILATTAIYFKAEQNTLFCPIVFLPFVSHECLAVDTFYNILHNSKKAITFFNLFLLGYVIAYIHSGIIMLGTIRRQFLGTVPYITKYLRQYVCEVLAQIPPLKTDFIHHLCYIGHTEKLKKVFEESVLVKKETLFQKDHYGRTALELARNLETLSFLIQQGADIETLNQHSGQSLLHIYSQKGNKEILDFLIQKGLEINRKDIKGRTALDYAKNKKLREFLISKGAKPTYLNMTKILNYIGIPR